MHGSHELQGEYRDQIVKMPPFPVICSATSTRRAKLSRSQSSTSYTQGARQRRILWMLAAGLVLSLFAAVGFVLHWKVWKVTAKTMPIVLAKDSSFYPTLGYSQRGTEQTADPAEKAKTTLIISSARFKDEASKLQNTPGQPASFLVLYASSQSEDPVMLANGPFEALTFAWCKFTAATGRFPERVIFFAEENSAQERYLLTSLYPSAMKMDIPVEYRRASVLDDKEEFSADSSGFSSFDSLPAKLDPFDCSSLTSSESLLRREAVAEQCPSMAPYLLACAMSKSSQIAARYSPPWQVKINESE